MTHLLYYTELAVDALRAGIEEHLDWYYTGEGPAPEPTGVDRAIRDSHLDAVDIAGELQFGEGDPIRHDPENAVAVYLALAKLKPQEAAQERLWTHLCHVECAEYVRARWMQRRPEAIKEAVRNVENHFFAHGNRALIRDNAISRLWWLGKIARDVSKGAELEFLQILMHRQDIRSALIERASLSMNRDVLRGIYAQMREHWRAEGQDAPIFERETFRDWMIRLNRRGGVVLLDALPEDALEQIIEREAEAAIAAA